jgi:hypothetical protein
VNLDLHPLKNDIFVIVIKISNLLSISVTGKWLNLKSSSKVGNKTVDYSGTKTKIVQITYLTLQQFKKYIKTLSRLPNNLQNILNPLTLAKIE